MNKVKANQAEKKYNKLIVILSIIIPLIVIILFGVKIPNVEPLMFLPPIYATINALTALVLIGAFMAITNNKILLHKRLMTFAIILSGLFNYVCGLSYDK